jgi:Tol biopolymer transport system component
VNVSTSCAAVTIGLGFSRAFRPRAAAPGGLIGRLAVVAATVAATLALTTPSAFALHQESDPATRVTLGADHEHSGGRHWSTRAIAFSSEVDLLNNGSTGRQIYVFDLLAFDCNRFSTKPGTPCPRPRRPALTQVTHGPGASDNPTLVFSEDGQFIAFDADGSYNGGNGPGVGHRQIFLEDLITGEIIRVTDAADGNSIRPQINAGGQVVAFESTAALKGRTDLTGISQIFSYRRQYKLRIGTLIQLTTGRGPSLHPRPNRGGDQLVFQSSANLFGDNADLGVFQIIYAGIDWASVSFTLVPLTSGNASSIRPYLAGKQDVAVFESSATSFGDAQVGLGNQIYMLPTNQGPLPPIQQITTQDPYGDCSFPVLNDFADGIAMICTGDPLQNGTTGNRAFVLSLGAPNLGTDLLHQITGRGDVKGPLGNYMGRAFLTLSDNSDLAGSEFCGYQLYIVDFFKDEKTGQEFWHSATQFQDLPDDLTPPPPPPPPPDTNVLGKHTFALNIGTPEHASQLAATTSSGTASVEITDVGQLRLEFGAKDFNDEAPVTVLTDNLATSIPPTNIPGLGTICVAPTGDPGAGVIDCNGGKADGDELIEQFHGNDPANPGCIGGCFEARTGTCRGPHVGTCRGPVTTERSGFFSSGQLQITVPVKVSISTFDGFDGLPCTADDDYTITNVALDMPFTSGNLSTTIFHANAGSDILTTSATGTPFECSRLAMNDLQGMRLIGMLPLLDVPNFDGKSTDVILTYKLGSTKDVAHGACNPVICTMALQCDDGDPNNGVEDCENRICIPGAPPCDDGNPCNGVATKDPNTGGCIPGTPPDCGDGDACTADICSASVGCIHTPTCDDHNACDGVETCDPNNGTCGAGTSLSCDDNDPCTDDSCNPVTGCVHVPTTRCDDGDACNGVETCNPTTGACGAGTPPDCDDQNACTTDSCNLAVGCVHSSKCDDGNACNGSETCDPSSGVCGLGVTLSCDDNNACTIDSCSPTSGCTHKSKCDDGNACNGIETCNSANGGTCGPGTPPNCDDNNACTIDTCSEASGCVHATNCDDGNACTDDTCSPTLGCQHVAKASKCNDGNPCTDDTCDAVDGCKHVNNTKPCSDGSVCTTGDVCQGGICHGNPVCDDGDVCNGVETCDGTAQCHDVTPPIPMLFYFSCQMNQLSYALQPVVDSFTNAPLTAAGGKFRQHSVLLRLTGIQRKLLAFSTTVRRAKSALGSAERKLASLTRSLRLNMLNGHMQADLADASLQTTTEVLARMDELKLKLP